MGNFDKGVSFYTKGTILVTVKFPEGDIRCRWCRFCKQDNGIRHKCTLTDRILYSTEIVPDECPLIFEEETNEQSNPI